MKKKRNDFERALEDWQDWLNHQYLAGYYVGGRIPPFLLGKHPNRRLGWLLLVSGTITAIAVTLSVLSQPWPAEFDLCPLGLIVFGVSMAVLQLAAGINLLRRSARKRKDHK